MSSPTTPSSYCMLFITLIFVFQSEKMILYDTVKAELEEKIRRLEEDRHNIDISSGKHRIIYCQAWNNLMSCVVHT